MKHDVIQYERIYNLLKNRIESGILPVGARLPGRSVLCGEFGTSERTIRRALELLEQDGYLEIAPRKNLQSLQVTEDISGLCWIDSDTHTFKNGLYFCKLGLNFRNLMNETSAGQAD